jgi:hypothetical protein
MPRKPADADAVRRLVEQLGRITAEPATLYLVGGASAVIEGWRGTTIDVDIRLEPEREEILRAIPRIKEELDLNIELASPVDFLPELPGWRDRSPFIAQKAQLTVRHFDFYSQALAKVERDFVQDRADVEAMIGRGLVDPNRLSELFDDVADQLYRFPAVDPKSLGANVRALAGTRTSRYQGSPSEES